MLKSDGSNKRATAAPKINDKHQRKWHVSSEGEFPSRLSQNINGTAKSWFDYAAKKNFATRNSGCHVEK